MQDLEAGNGLVYTLETIWNLPIEITFFGFLFKDRYTSPESEICNKY